MTVRVKGFDRCGFPSTLEASGRMGGYLERLDPLWIPRLGWLLTRCYGGLRKPIWEDRLGRCGSLGLGRYVRL